MKLKFYELGSYSKNHTKQLIIFLHGYGANGMDLLSLSEEFKVLLPDAYFISPDAPFQCEMGSGYQWFSLHNRNESVMFVNMQPASEILDNFITEQLTKLNLNEKDLILIGFSQGAMMALHTAPRRESPSVIIAHSGMLVEGAKLKNDAKSKPKMLLIHGDIDEVIPPIKFSKSVEYLEKNKFPIESHLINNLGHNINNQSLQIAKEFIKTKILK